MRDSDAARRLLIVARRDLEVLEVLGDRCADEAFGFHAQQAVEKALKAWLAGLGVAFPKLHHLHVFVNLLEQQGCEVARFRDLIRLNDYAVQFRYSVYDAIDPLDRSAIHAAVKALVDHVAEIADGELK